MASVSRRLARGLDPEAVRTAKQFWHDYLRGLLGKAPLLSAEEICEMATKTKTKGTQFPKGGKGMTATKKGKAC